LAKIVLTESTAKAAAFAPSDPTGGKRMSVNADRPQLLSLIRDTLAEIVDDPGLSLTEASNAQDVPYLDSINHMKLIIILEEELGVRFEADEIAEIQNVGQLIDAIQERQH
jgi:acyl carrier protein